MTALLTRGPRAHRPPPVTSDRQRHAKELAYLGCAGALGYGLMKVDWALGGTIGLRNPEHFHATDNRLTAAGRLFDQWGSQTLAGLAIVILLGLVYPWGNRPILRPLLRALGWAGSLMTVVGVAGVILITLYFAGDQGVGRGDLYAGTFLFTYICFTMLGVAFAGTAWLTRPRRSSAPRTLSPSTRPSSRVTGDWR